MWVSNRKDSHNQHPGQSQSTGHHLHQHVYIDVFEGKLWDSIFRLSTLVPWRADELVIHEYKCCTTLIAQQRSKTRRRIELAASSSHKGQKNPTLMLLSLGCLVSAPSTLLDLVPCFSYLLGQSPIQYHHLLWIHGSTSPAFFDLISLEDRSRVWYARCTTHTLFWVCLTESFGPA